MVFKYWEEFCVISIEFDFFLFIKFMEILEDCSMEIRMEIRRIWGFFLGNLFCF